MLFTDKFTRLQRLDKISIFWFNTHHCHPEPMEIWHVWTGWLEHDTLEIKVVHFFRYRYDSSTCGYVSHLTVYTRIHSLSLKSSSSGVLEEPFVFYVLLRKPIWICFAFLLLLHTYPSSPTLVTIIQNNVQNETTELEGVAPTTCSLISHIQMEVTLTVSKYVIHSQPLRFCQLLYILDKLAISTSISILFI